MANKPDIEYIKDCMGKKLEKSGLFLWEHACKTADYLRKTLIEYKEIDNDSIDVLCTAALGHDLLEDTKVTEKDILEQWGATALEYIKELTNEEGDKDCSGYIDRLKKASEETLLLKFSDIYANASNSVTRFDKLDREWVRTFWFPLLNRYKNHLMTRKFLKYPKTAGKMINDINVEIQKLQGRIGLFKQFDYFHEFHEWLTSFIKENFNVTELSEKSVKYIGCNFDGFSQEISEAGLWRKALSDGEDYIVGVSLTLNLDGEDYEIPYFNVPMVTPRGTFIIDGKERLPLKTLQLIEDFSPDFTLEQFVPVDHQQALLEDLCSTLKKDLQNLPEYSNEDSVNWLNRLIEMPNLVNLINARNGKRKYAKEIQLLINKTRKYRNEKDVSKIPVRVRDKIKRLNRLLLEKNYPSLVPKGKNPAHLTDAEKLRDLSKFRLVEENFYFYLKKALQREIEKYAGRKEILRYIADPDAEGGLDRFIGLFHTSWASHKFPFLDSTNPLAELEHMRRVAFTRGEMAKTGRSIHPSHYGRVCVVETPESEKIGLRLHLAHKAQIDENGQLLTPVIDRETLQAVTLSPDDRSAVADLLSQNREKVLTRGGEDAQYCDPSKLKYTDAYVDQLLGYAALQVPFIHHNDPARALMGAKNLKQAVPLVNPEVPIVKTGYEQKVAEMAGRTVRSIRNGTVVDADTRQIVVQDNDGGIIVNHLIHDVDSVMSKAAVFQKPLVTKGASVDEGQIIAEGASSKDGQLALGVNLLVAYMPYFGYNMDDGIVLSQTASEKLTSVHIERIEYKVPNGALPEWFIPDGTKIKAGETIARFSKRRDTIDFSEEEFKKPYSIKELFVKLANILADQEMTSEPCTVEWLNEALTIPGLFELFKEKGADTLPKLPRGITELLSQTAPYRSKPLNELDVVRQNKIRTLNRLLVEKIFEKLAPKSKSKVKIELHARNEMIGSSVIRTRLDLNVLTVWIRKVMRLEVGDKMMGRHGNKGVVALILPDEEMPYFEYRIKTKDENGNSTHKSVERRRIEMILNPHSVISRMNVGQILETHYGWVAQEHPDVATRNKASMMGKPFNQTDLGELARWLEESGLDAKGRAPILQQSEHLTMEPVVVGYQYVVKLNHLASGKFSIRGEKGPVSYMTGLPIAGKKTGGGQRIGEMEVWALLSHNARGIVNSMLGWRANAGLLGKSKAVTVSESLKVLVYLWRGLGISFEFLDKDRNVVEPEMFDQFKRSQLYQYRVSRPAMNVITEWGYHVEQPKKGKHESLKDFLERKMLEKDIKKGAKRVETLNDLQPEYKDEMGYIMLREPVELCGQEIDYLPVIPPRCRPHSKSKLNRLYREILMKEKELERIERSYIGWDPSVKQLKVLVKELEHELLRLASGKDGILRRAVLGKRVNYSARAVIVPDPQLKPYQARIPKEIMDAFRLQDNDKVLLNRQPTLHVHNIQSFDALCGESRTIGLNPIVCGGFNADFDGDTMAVYKVDKGIDLPQHMDSREQIIRAANGELNISLSQDIVSGIYSMTQTEEGRWKLVEIINDEKIYAGEKPVTKPILDEIVYSYYQEKKDTAATLDFANKLAQLGLQCASFSGLSLSVFDLLDVAFLEDDRNQILSGFSPDQEAEEALKNKLSDMNENPLNIMVHSKARGSYENIRQMIAFRGSIEKMRGSKSTTKIPSSYLEGLTPTEYYLACYGARKTLGDKKMVTPECGYLTRKLVYAASDIVVGEEDCGTTKGIDLETNLALGRVRAHKDVVIELYVSADIDDFLETYAELHRKLNLKRYWAFGEVTLELEEGEEIIDQSLQAKLTNQSIVTVRVRSPLTCESRKGICQKCYGWELSRQAFPPIGFTAGIMAAEVIGERATQDAMRSYHKGRATKTITSFDRAKTIFDDVRGPDSKNKPPDKIRDLGDIIKMIRELHKDVYEGKVDFKHYEVIMRALMSEEGVYYGTKEMIRKKPPLHSASFEKAKDVILGMADNADTYGFKTPLEKLFF